VWPTGTVRRATGPAEYHVEQILDSTVPGQRGYEPKGVVISSENLSRTSLVNGISFHSPLVRPSSGRSV
jgi:hypothetical protein